MIDTGRLYEEDPDHSRVPKISPASLPDNEEGDGGVIKNLKKT